MSKNKARPDFEPESVRSEAYVPAEDLRELGQAMMKAGVSERTRLLFARLASLAPHIRLAVNMKTLIGLMADKDIRNILTEGLTPNEHSALVELDIKGLSIRTREYAHGLLNVHERWRLMKDVRRPFRDARRAKDCFIDLNAEEKNDPDSGS